MEKKRIVKVVAGAIAYLTFAFASQSVIREKVTKKPHKEIALQLSSAFWSIIFILYSHYYIGEKEES